MKFDNMQATREEMKAMKKEYLPRVKGLLAEFRSKVAYKEYCVGGEVMNRGYFCPSLTLDIIVGGVHRGRLFKHKPTSRKPSWTYGFDSQDRLILAWDGYTNELIFHQGQIETGITVDNDMDIIFITKCIFDDGRISTYIGCDFSGYFSTKTFEIFEEKYEYQGDKFVMDRSDYMDPSDYYDKNVFSLKRYTFSIENGYLKTYVIQEFDKDGNEKNTSNKRIYPVLVKRKMSV